MPIRPNVDPVITQNVYNLTSEKGYEGHRFNKIVVVMVREIAKCPSVAITQRVYRSIWRVTRRNGCSPLFSL